jgi:putative transposase
MRRYLRARVPGGTCFFTVVLSDRASTLLTDHVDALRESFRVVRAAHPFITVAIVVMPDHPHTVWTLPESDADYSTRWALIKSRFSRAIVAGEPVSHSRTRRRERGVWQRRVHEHAIRDDDDLQRHIDYIHWNPVKHRHAARPIEWLYSSIHRYVREGTLAPDWAASPDIRKEPVPE